MMRRRNHEEIHKQEEEDAAQQEEERDMFGFLVSQPNDSGKFEELVVCSGALCNCTCASRPS